MLTAMCLLTLTGCHQLPRQKNFSGRFFSPHTPRIVRSIHKPILAFPINDGRLRTLQIISKQCVRVLCSLAVALKSSSSCSSSGESRELLHHRSGSLGEIFCLQDRCIIWQIFTVSYRHQAFHWKGSTWLILWMLNE